MQIYLRIRCTNLWCNHTYSIHLYFTRHGKIVVSIKCLGKHCRSTRHKNALKINNFQTKKVEASNSFSERECPSLPAKSMTILPYIKQ